MASKIYRQVILHNTQGSHNKYYEVSIKKMEDMKDLYFVEARWGRIENFQDGSPQSQVKVEAVQYATANEKLGDLMYAKLKKGYKTINDTASGHKANEYHSKSEEKRVKIQKGLDPFERTEHIEVVVTDWWKNDNIEERSI